MMSFDPITAAFDLGKIAIEKLWPDANSRAIEFRKLEEMRQAGNLAELNAHVETLTGQLKINMEEAKHPSVFVAGWRPFVGWVGGLSFAYIGLIEPFMRFIANLAGYTGAYPVIDTSLTMQALMGMLGIGALRSYEKSKGVETRGIGK